MFSFLFSLPIIVIWLIVSYQTVPIMDLWMFLLATPFFFVPNWISHELIPDAWTKKEPSLKDFIWVRFFRDRKIELRFRIFFSLSGILVALCSYIASILIGGTAFLITIILMSLVVFVIGHLLALWFKEGEIKSIE